MGDPNWRGGRLNLSHADKVEPTVALRGIRPEMSAVDQVLNKRTPDQDVTGQHGRRHWHFQIARALCVSTYSNSWKTNVKSRGGEGYGEFP